MELKDYCPAFCYKPRYAFTYIVLENHAKHSKTNHQQLAHQVLTFMFSPSKYAFTYDAFNSYYTTPNNLGKILFYYAAPLLHHTYSICPNKKIFPSTDLFEHLVGEKKNEGEQRKKSGLEWHL
eukprot:1572324-Amphidinium_carterae.1